MNILKRELKSHRKALIFWSIGMFFLILSGVSKYSAYQGSGQSANELMDKLPKVIKTLFGIGSFDLNTVMGFYGVLFPYIALMAAIHAAILGSEIISKEERDKTSEFLFAKPIARSAAVTQKILAALINILVINAITWILSIALVTKYAKGADIGHPIALLMIGLLFLQLIFLSFGMAFAAKAKKPKKSTSAVTGLLLSTYILAIIIDLSDKLNILKYFTPFKYFDAKNIIPAGKLDPTFMLLSLVIIALGILATYKFYANRDLAI